MGRGVFSRLASRQECYPRNSVGNGSQEVTRRVSVILLSAVGVHGQELAFNSLLGQFVAVPPTTHLPSADDSSSEGIRYISKANQKHYQH